MEDRFIPEYVSDGLLGEGAFGRVYRVHNQRAEDFALKILKAKNLQKKQGLEPEVRVLSRLNHPNLIAIHEYLPDAGNIQGVEDKGPGYIMEFVPGKTLEDLEPETPWEEWEDLFVQVLRGLHYLHTRHLVHGDLKPANLRLGKKKALKILDFGLAARLGEREGEILGTMDYLAPEALEGKRTSRSDLFSLGVVFYRLLTGQLPFDSEVELSQRFLLRPKGAAELNGKIPGYFSDILARLLEVDPGRRFSSALNVLRALNHRSTFSHELTEEETAKTSLENVPFVGRAATLEENEFRLAQWESGALRTPVWWLHGKTGVGKSRMLGEMVWQAKMRGIEVIHPDKPELPEAEKPILVIFPDLNSMSPRALKTLRKEMESLPVKGRFLGVIFEFNDDYLTDALSDLLPLRNTLSNSWDLSLSGFSPEETQAFLEEVFFEGPLPPSVQETLHHLSSGNPSLLVALCDFARKHGGLSFLKKAPRAWDFEDTSLPENIQASFQRDWEDLSADERAFLTSIYLLRGNFDLQVYPGVLNISESRLKTYLDKFSARGWVQTKNRKIQATQPFLKALLLNLLGKAAAHKLQKQWLQGLEHGFEASDYLLARLAWGAEDLERFRKFGMAAAESLVNSGRPQAALDLYSDLLTVSPSTEQQTLIYAFQAAALARLARWDEALKAYDQWYQRTEDDGTDIQTIKYHYLTGTVFLNRGQLAKARNKFELALSTGDSQRFEHHVPFHLKSLIHLGKVFEKEKNFKDAQEAYERGIKLAKGDSTDKAQLLRNMGLLALAQGNQGPAKKHLEASLQMSERLSYDEGIANTAYVLANLAHREGNYDQALETYRKVLEIAEKSEDPLKKARTLSNMAAVLVEIADYPRALEYAGRAQPILDERGNHLDRLLNGFHLQSLQIYLGNFERGQDPALSNLARQANSPEMLAYIHRLRAEGLRLQRDFQGALQAYGEASDRFWKSGNFQEYRITLLHQCLTECLAGDLQTARKILKDWDRKKDMPAQGDIKEIFEMASSFLNLSAAPPASLVQEKVQSVLKSGQQELVILALLGCSEILTRIQDQEGAEYLRRRAFEWLESLYRGLPEEMQLSFEHREDFKRLAEARLQKLKATGISRDRFLTFAKINKRMSEESKMDSVLQQVMDAAMALAGAERGFLLIRDQESEGTIISGYRVETARNMKKENIGTDEFKISLSVVEEALRRRVAILTDDAQADPNFQNAESVHLYQLKSILVLPLVGEAGCLGALYLDHRFEVGAFSEEGLLFLKAFADQAVLAIEKAKTLTALNEAKAALENRVEEQALQIEQMEVQLKEARQGLRFGYEEIIGHSPKMIKILQLLDRVTDTQVPVWIHGESGTGKELIARALHYNSDRKERPFITENCSAIPENLLESVLFGHVKGAFTHAERDKMGLFEAADGGTIFLDEIGDMPLPMQSKLLRVLQEGEIRRVGSNESKPIDVRVVSATNKDLPRLVKEGKFREDLFFRLNGIKIELPALRERKEDLPPLVQHFIQKVAAENQLEPCSITEEALKAMAQYDWPGNIRELENTVRNAVLFADGQTITRDTLGFKPELFEAPKPKPKEETAAAGYGLGQKEKREVDAQREAILDALVRASFHKGQAAQDLGVTPRHLYNLLEKYELPKNKWALKKLVEEERGSL